MPQIQSVLANVLGQVQRVGDYYASGTQDIHPPRLSVDGVGPVSLPLLPVQAEQLVAVAEQAPYGRGSETLVDTGVRRTWQIDAAQVRIEGRRWAEDLAEMVERVRDGLGVAGRVEAALYKLLVYDTGSFFISHRDTEKAAGMFATLVLVLPSAFSGGELIVRHRGREARLDLHRDEPSEVAYAAFYADCRHEVLPIASGCRLALVYNLIRPDGEPLPAPPDQDTPVQEAARVLGIWDALAAKAEAEAIPDKLVWPLEHAYSEAELGFDTLKGVDKAVAGILVGAAGAADCDLYLAHLSVEQRGWAEYAGGGRWGEAVQYEIGDVEEELRELHDWRLPDGGASVMGRLSFGPEELCPADALAGLDDEPPDFHEATGNEGVSFERSYQWAALVLWPRSRRAAVLAAGGVPVSVPFLTGLVDDWEQSGADAADARRGEAIALAAAIRAAWPTDPWHHRQLSNDGLPSALLDALGRLGERNEIGAFIAGQSATGAYGPGDNAAIARTLAMLAPARAADLLTAVVANNAPCRAAACAELIGLCAAQSADWPRLAAMALLAALPTEPVAERGMQLGYGYGYGHGCEPPAPELVVATLVALERIESALAEQALDLFLGHPAVYALDPVLRPAALALADGEGPISAAVARLRAAVLADLERRIAEPLEPPADWTRPAEIDCRCAYCRDLDRFLRAPDQAEWRLKAAQDGRKHVEHRVRYHRCDLDLTTDKRGRPYTLICTKNQASYERRVAGRAQALADRELLSG